MRWRDARPSTNVRNRGGMGGIGAIGGGAGLIIALIAMVLGVDLPGGGGDPLQEGTTTALPNDSAVAFVEGVLGDTEDTWNAIFAEQGATYEEPILNLFNGMVQSACGMASSAVGPFYCSLDRQVYLDLSFFQDLHDKFGASGDFAQAYVIAHEVGHHVQNLMGVSDRVAGARQGASEEAANRLSVRLELQADCFAGIWANKADRERQLIQAGDIEEALGAASAIGDDRLQRQAQGQVVPESFTHGTSEQRARWFRNGFESGDVARCDTFSATEL